MCYVKIKKPSVPEFGQSDQDVLGRMLKSNEFQLEEPEENFQKTFSVKSYSYLFIKIVLKEC